MSTIEMKVPSPGESINEVIIANWLVKNGDYVENGQAIAEIDSDKATLELTAETSGAITLKAAAGDTVKVGAIVCLIDTSAKKPEGAVVAKSAQAKKQEPAKQEAVAAPKVEKATYATGTPSPAAAKIMAENGISAAQVNGTGPGGRITKGDVLVALSGGFENQAVTARTTDRTERREKMTTLRRKISERLVNVKNTTAMLTTFNEVNM
ncbi:MAG: E3 binding domain-containing protein, partial [Flavobacteriales bacterium]|nr:E3 binding domain-containing protein [Flavobacteriales bacterium]